MARPAKHDETIFARDVLTEMEQDGVLPKALPYWNRIFTEKREEGMSCKVYRQMTKEQAIEFIRRVHKHIDVANIEIIKNKISPLSGYSVRFSF